MKNQRAAGAKPRARADGLVIRELADELLVYDLEAHESHCLNRTAALIWRRCDGQTGASEIARQVADKLDSPVDEQAVWFAFGELKRRKLLSEPLPQIADQQRVSRRDLIRRVGMAAVLLPLITSITAPTALAVVSCSGSCDQMNPCTGANCNCVNNMCVAT